MTYFLFKVHQTFSSNLRSKQKYFSRSVWKLKKDCYISLIRSLSILLNKWKKNKAFKVIKKRWVGFPPTFLILIESSTSRWVNESQFLHISRTWCRELKTQTEPVALAPGDVSVSLFEPETWSELLGAEGLKTVL